VDFFDTRVSKRPYEPDNLRLMYVGPKVISTSVYFISCFFLFVVHMIEVECCMSLLPICFVYAGGKVPSSFTASNGVGKELA
jgi:hypothetical protein